VSDQVEAAIRALVEALRDELRQERPPAPVGLDPLVSMADAGALLGIHRSAIYPLIESGTLRSVKVGRRRMIVASSIRAMVDPADPRSVRAVS
jgi:excisionase family DNA binding protein